LENYNMQQSLNNQAAVEDVWQNPRTDFISWSTLDQIPGIMFHHLPLQEIIDEFSSHYSAVKLSLSMLPSQLKNTTNCIDQRNCLLYCWSIYLLVIDFSAWILSIDISSFIVDIQLY
jgi:hypothetical protein